MDDIIDLDTSEDMLIFKMIFMAVFELANYDMTVLGYTFTPLDLWVFTAIMYMVVDTIMAAAGFTSNEYGDHD